jgi:hypothetical protein
MDRATYLRELAAAYQGEVRGEAMFRTLAEHAGDAAAAETWRALARLEATTRARLLPLLRRHGLDTLPDPEQERLGRQRGEARAALGHAGAVRAMSDSLPKYVTLYAELAAAGPAEDRDGLAFLNAHELALQQFCARRTAGRDDALAPVLALLCA